MRSGTKLIVALMFLLSACGGSGGSANSAPRDASCGTESCAPETESPPAPLRCDSPDASSCPQGYRCVDDSADDCDPATGTECGGICVLGEELPGCGFGQQGCPPGSVCVDDPNDGCDAGLAADCPGTCQPESTGGCETDADCPAIPAVCNICADGSASCASARCEDGVCTVDAPTCPTPVTCGGVAGRPCAPGFHCVDDPADACSSDNNDADCGGICVPGEESKGCAGITGAACPPGFTCVDDPNDSCDQNTGADCPGTCEPGQQEECTSDADCVRLPLPCPLCPDGSEACPKQGCENGRCSVEFRSCPPAILCGDNGIGCNAGEVCVDDPADQCDPVTGSTGCKGKCVTIDQPRECGADANVCPPGYECASPDGSVCEPDAAGNGCRGVCVPSTPRECSTDDECPHVLAPCVPCPGGTFSCPRTECRNAQCTMVMDGCSDPGFCGGIAGFPCPPGLTCVDNPNDECDPQRGGADCAGMCVREEKPPVCGGLPGAACPPGYECADDPADECDPANGAADCRGICRPVTPPTCVSDAECFIGAPCRICPDGTAACPIATCTNGACQVQFGTCGAQ